MSWLDGLTTWRGPRPLGPGGSQAEGVRTLHIAREHGVSERSFGDALFPRFQATASDQLRARAGDRFASARLRLRSSYTPSQPVIDRRMFAGRTAPLASVIRAIEDEHLHAVIYGDRGIGKTSLMHVLAEAAREARYHISYISCGAGSNFDETFRTVAGDLPLLFHSGYGPTAAQAERGGTFADLLPQGPVSARVASDVCARLVGTRLLIVLDEFDRAESREFRLSIAEFLKSLSDRSVRVQLLIAGVAANLTELVEHIPSIQRSIFALEVPRMSEAEVRQLVQKGEELSGLAFDEEARDTIVAVANGFPYLASLLCHHAGLRAIDDSRLAVTADDAAAAVAEALVELRGRISKQSLQQIAGCVRDGSIRILGALASVARCGGIAFNISDISTIRPGSDEAVLYRSLLDGLADEGVLIERREDEFGRSYRFVEESVPIYLWLLTARDRFAGNGSAALEPSAERAVAQAI